MSRIPSIPCLAPILLLGLGASSCTTELEEADLEREETDLERDETDANAGTAPTSLASNGSETAAIASSCCETGPAGACGDSSVQACVCAVDSFCCTTGWDATCVQEVDSLGCGSCYPDDPCCSPTATPGCEAPSVQSCVCGADPYCCTTAWDLICVGEVESLGCGVCSDAGADIEATELSAPPSACPGEDIGAPTRLRLANIGSTDVDEHFFVGWYLSNDSVLDGTDRLLIGGRDSVFELQSGASVELERSANIIPEDAQLGARYLIVSVDEFDVIDESREDNNFLAVPITIDACEETTTVQLAAGGRQTCALSSAGAVRCWGIGEYGVLGHGNTQNIGDDELPSEAGDVPLGGPAIDIAAGAYHTCAILEGGGVRCWGRNDLGQLGQAHTMSIGDDETPDTAPLVSLGGDAVELAAGVHHTCARLESGAVRCWGEGAFGALGYASIATIGNDETPAAAGDVPLGGAAIALAAGQFHTCAVLEGGALRCWGANFNGTLGYGHTRTIGDDETPASAGNVGVGALVSAVSGGSTHSCGLTTAGTIRCWGGGDDGRLGYGNRRVVGDDESPSAVGDVLLGTTARSVSVGGEHSCAVTTAGTVRCWGYVVGGGLGYVGTSFLDRPGGDVEIGGAVRELASGYGQICAVLETGAVRCWGDAPLLGYATGSDIGDDETPASAGDVSIW